MWKYSLDSKMPLFFGLLNVYYLLLDGCSVIGDVSWGLPSFLVMLLSLVWIDFPLLPLLDHPAFLQSPALPLPTGYKGLFKTQRVGVKIFDISCFFHLLENLAAWLPSKLSKQTELCFLFQNGFHCKKKNPKKTEKMFGLNDPERWLVRFEIHPPHHAFIASVSLKTRSSTSLDAQKTFLQVKKKKKTSTCLSVRKTAWTVAVGNSWSRLHQDSEMCTRCSDAIIERLYVSVRSLGMGGWGGTAANCCVHVNAILLNCSSYWQRENLKKREAEAAGISGRAFNASLLSV